MINQYMGVASHLLSRWFKPIHLPRWDMKPSKVARFHSLTNSQKGHRQNYQVQYIGWWQLKYYFIFTPKIGEDEPILTSIFFKWVGSTTKKIYVSSVFVALGLRPLRRFTQHVSPLRGRLMFFIKSFGKNLTTRYTLW